MCGIYGAWPITPSVARMLPIIGLEMESRGRDAWGASNGEEVVRHVGPLHETWYEDYDKFHGWKAGIFHTRGASHGSAKALENAHPFTYLKEDGSSVIGIHNGIVSNHKELDSKYGRNFDVDSMHLWKSRAEGHDWSDIEGWGNLAWWETTFDKDDNREYRDLHLARFNNSALELFQLQDGEYIFASTQASVRVAAKMMGNPVDHYVHLDEYTHYFLRQQAEEEVKLWKAEALPFPRPGRGGRNGFSIARGGSCGFYGGEVNGIPFGPANTSHGTGGMNLEWCIICGSTRVNTDNQILCGACLLNMIMVFERETRSYDGREHRAL